METRPECARPQGTPRWVALFYRPDEASWQVGAESPDRSPVLYALGEMTQTLRARGDEVTVALWGPKGEDWHRYDASATSVTSTTSATSATWATATTSVPAPEPASAAE